MAWEGVGRNGHNLRATWRSLGGESEKGKGLWPSEDSGQVRVETAFRGGGGKAEALRCPRQYHEALQCQFPGYWPPGQERCCANSPLAVPCLAPSNTESKLWRDIWGVLDSRINILPIADVASVQMVSC